MGIKIWLDDIRPPPDNTWMATTTAVSAIDCFSSINNVEFISFDHDLGTKLTGYSVAKFIELMAYEGKLKRVRWDIHSANPVGKANIEMAMRKAEEYWDNQDN